MNKYKRLISEEREEISRMLAQKCSFQSIVKALGRNVSTVSREAAADGSELNRQLVEVQNYPSEGFL